MNHLFSISTENRSKELQIDIAIKPFRLDIRKKNFLTKSVVKFWDRLPGKTGILVTRNV